MFKRNLYLIFLFLIIFSFSVLAYDAVNCWDYDGTNQTACEDTGLCNWDSNGDWCFSKGCWLFTTSDYCNDAANLSCTWKTNSDGGWCEMMGCWSLSDETSCDNNTLCDWDNDYSYCSQKGCWDYSSETVCETQSELDVTCRWKNGWCEENGSCWEYWDNQASCQANSKCVWENNSYNSTGATHSYTNCYRLGCGNFTSETDCWGATSSLNLPCNWNSDPGWCEKGGCWNFDGEEDDCNNADNTYNLSCTWSAPYCNSEWGCNSYYSEKTCTDTYYCIWSDTLCVEPSGGIIEGDYVNPSCWIFSSNYTTCENISGCSFANSTNDCGGTPSDIGIRCGNITESNICNSISILSTCCTWENGLCNATFGGQCYDNIKDMPTDSGNEITKCEDATSQQVCNQITNDPWYMPCKWDNMSTTSDTDDKCLFNNDDYDINLNEVGGKKLCEMAGGKYVCDCYKDFVGNSTSECTCVIETGAGTSDCDFNCMACEYKSDGSAWESYSAVADACNNSKAGCEFTTDSNAKNTYGWCDYPSSVYYGYGDCDTDCYNCYTNQTCSGSLSNCSWSLPMSSGWCEDATKAQCWNKMTQTTCTSAGSSCNWNVNYSYCEMLGCWSYNNQNDCNAGSSPSGFGCSWDSQWNTCEEKGCWTFDVDHCENTTNIDDCYWDSGGSWCKERGCWDYWDENNCTSTTDYLDCSWQGTSQDNGWCEDTAMYQAKTCSVSNCQYCYGQSDCENAGCQWNTTLIYDTTGTQLDVCIAIGTTPEICNNPGDEDEDGLSDCADDECNTDPNCGYGFGGDYSGTNFGMNSSIECWTYDYTNESICTTCNGTCSSGACYWHAVSGSTNWTTMITNWTTGNGYAYTDGYLCDPKFEETMGKGMEVGAPTELGGDNLQESKVTNQEWLDIARVGMHDMPDNLDIGISVYNITNFSGCVNFYRKISGNVSGKFYRYLDTDGNSTGGCTAKDEWGGQLIGFEYMFYYMKNASDETKAAYKCQSGDWQVHTATIAAMDEGCTWTDPFVSASEWQGVQVLVIQKQDIGNPTNDLRIFVLSANATSNESVPLDSAGPFYYTPGAFDFKFEDCMKSGVDLDGDGFTSEQDPDCAMMKTYGYIMMEEGPQCNDNVDNDGDGDIDCSDANCKYNDLYCTTYTFTDPDPDDNTAPSIKWLEVNEQPNGSFVMYDTDEPANGTLLFYYNESTCENLNYTINDSGITEAFMDDYKTWHDGPIDNYDYNSQKIGYHLGNNKSYYYKIKVCDPSGNCAISACNNFTTRFSESNKYCPTCSSKFKFDFTPATGIATSDLEGNMKLEGDFTGNDGVYETQMSDDCGCNSATYINYTNLQNFSLKYTNPNSTKDWGLTLKDSTAKKGTLSDELSNLTSTDFIVEDTGTVDGKTVTFVGIDDEKWNKIKTEVVIDYVDINLPGNQEELWHCDDDLENCLDVTDDDGAENMGYNGSDDFTTWRISASLYDKVGM